jgi:hypothetical protein
MARIKTALLAAALVAVTALPARAQTAADVRRAQLSMLALQQRMILSMIDSMPDAQFRAKATPAQRDFAMQLFHTASALPFIMRITMGANFPGPMDSTAATANKAALRSFVNTTYNWASSVLRDQPDSIRTQEVNLFGNRMPRWQVWDELHQHSMWTLGQVVANFRALGRAPAPFMFF